MDAVRILESSAALTWEYDDEADVLYISEGRPRPAITVDVGEGVLARFTSSSWTAGSSSHGTWTKTRSSTATGMCLRSRSSTRAGGLMSGT